MWKIHKKQQYQKEIKTQKILYMKFKNHNSVEACPGFNFNPENNIQTIIKIRLIAITYPNK